MYWITGILGLALIAAPFALGHSANSTVVNFGVVLGVAIIIASGYKALAHDMANWEYGIAGIVGLAALIGPFVLGFSAQANGILVLGAIVLILAGYQVFFVEPPEIHETR